MPREVSEIWEKVRHAQEKLEEQFIDHPDVSLIDIGYVPKPDTNTEEITLRIHVRERCWEAMSDDRIAFPDQVDGIPVIVIPGDYWLESDGPRTGDD